MIILNNNNFYSKYSQTYLYLSQKETKRVPGSSYPTYWIYTSIQNAAVLVIHVAVCTVLYDEWF